MADHSPSTDRIFGAPGWEPPAAYRGGQQDSPRLVLLAIVLVVAALAWLLRLARRSSELTPDYLAEVVLYALSAACVVMLLALGFVLARNLIKILAERRRAVPFARFRAKLVAALIGLTLIPSVLVLLVGSEVIRSSAERWFSAPIDDALRSANAIARSVYQEQQEAATERAARLATRLGTVDLARVSQDAIDAIVSDEPALGGASVIDIYRVTIDDAGAVDTTRIAQVAEPFLPPGYPAASADQLAASLAAGNAESGSAEPLSDGAELLRGAALVRASPEGPVVGVVVASTVLSGELTGHARRINGAFGTYNQLRVLTRPVTGVYLSFFLMTTLMILIAATWLGTYVAKRITRPVQRLAEGARQIGIGHLDHRIEPESSDEFGGMVEAFNAMAADLSTSQQKLIQSRGDLEHTTRETERRRRYIETILERIATGVISIDSAGRLNTVNAAAVRLLTLEADVIGQPAAVVFERADLAPLGAMLREARRGHVGPAAREVALAREGRECHLAVAATTLPGDSGPDGVVMVFDDVTPLFRAQRVATWRDVARRLAHEIKNPLTPIQLCAERLRRNLASAAPETVALVNECTSTIVGEVEALKGLVDEFSHFARLPSPRAVPVNINTLLAATLNLYHGLFDGIAIVAAYDPGMPAVQLDPDQIQRVVVNLVDNAAAALGGEGGVGSTTEGIIRIETRYDATNHVARVTVSDNGPGIAEADRDKLFLPYFSTKGRGSGLGLAIVRRIVVEHGGSIEVSERRPRGTCFSIDLPCGVLPVDESVVTPVARDHA
ncbi:MAG: ATP-binding protein [Acidobacteria bacterium]|nr:ATP-binding protein [Acidobacteriota bacterium]